MIVRDYERGILLKHGNYIRSLHPGRHFFNPLGGYKVIRMNITQPFVVPEMDLDIFTSDKNLASELMIVDVKDYQIAIRYENDVFASVFLPYLMTRPEAHITNISSMGGFLPVPGQTIYGASKAAVKILTEGLSQELIDTKIKVMVVFPGGVGTDIMNNSGVKMSPKMEEMQKTIKITTPEKAAQLIINGIEKNRCRVLVGLDSVFMDLIYRLNPILAARLLIFLMRRILDHGE